MKKLGYGLLALASMAYIANPTLGVFELLPDALPGVGNIDEAGATMLLIYSLKQAGILPTSFLGGPKKQKDDR